MSGPHNKNSQVFGCQCSLQEEAAPALLYCLLSRQACPPSLADKYRYSYPVMMRLAVCCVSARCMTQKVCLDAMYRQKSGHESFVCYVQARSMTDKARFAAAGAMNNVRTAIDSAKRIGFPGNPVSLH